MKMEGKRKHISAIAGLALFLGSGLALAQKVDWDSNPEAGLMAELAERMPEKTIRQESSQAGKAQDEAGAKKNQIRLYAKGSAVTSRGDRFRGPTLSLVLNNEKDRVAISYTVCENDVEWESCDTTKFVVPELSYDPRTKSILLGDQVIATTHWFFGVRLEKGVRLGYDITTRKEDFGFDRRNVSRVQVYLEGNLKLKKD